MITLKLKYNDDDNILSLYSNDDKYWECITNNDIDFTKLVQSLSDEIDKKKQFDIMTEVESKYIKGNLKISIDTITDIINTYNECLNVNQ